MELLLEEPVAEPGASPILHHYPLMTKPTTKPHEHLGDGNVVVIVVVVAAVVTERIPSLLMKLAVTSLHHLRDHPTNDHVIVRDHVVKNGPELVRHYDYQHHHQDRQIRTKTTKFWRGI